ncbi:hypothetical protein FJ365_02210 [Candidatus Dependentiae bacterium]|nr:hypothetical protein [Candidatus Dependentiae bacterium]
MIFSHQHKQRAARLFFAAMWSVTLLPAVQASVETTASPAPEITSVYKKLAGYHLPSLAQKELAEQAVMQEIAKTNAEKIEKKELAGVSVPAVGDVEKMRIIYDIFNTAEATQAANLLDENAINDLNVLCGDKGAPENHIFSKIDHTLTSFGKVELQRMLAEPLTDISALKARQQIVQALISDQTLFNALDAHLTAMKQAETDMLWFWKQLDDSVKQFFDQIYAQADGFDATSAWNKSTAFMQLYNNWKTVGRPLCAALSPQIIVGLYIALIKLYWLSSDYRRMMGPEFARMNINPDEWSPFTTPFTATASAASFLYKVMTQDQVTIMGQEASVSNQDRLIIGGMYGLGLGLLGWFAYSQIKQAGQYNDTANVVHEHMMPAGTYAQTVDAMLATIAGAPVLQQAFPEHQELIAFNKAANEETQSLVDALKTDTFKGEPSFFSLRGRALASFKKMFAGKNHFVKSMQTIGKLDAYLSIAKLYKELASNSNARYCFVDYETATTPSLKIENFWVPMLDADKVVTNSIEMGGVNPRDIIVTGPNAGGKSTALKGVIDAIIMAQTLGIAPASSMILTPFTVIKSYMNIADTTGSASLFQAEMRRTQSLIESIKALRPDQFAFIIMDEIFTGTNHREGQAGAFGVVKKIAGFNNCICFFATHFKKLTELEAIMPGVVSNHKVTVTKNANGSFTFPYKLAQGITDQAIALDLLAQEGFDADVLTAAHGALAEAY